MKITKRQLKRIIQEERSLLLQEQGGAFEDVEREIVLMTGDVESGKGAYAEEEVYEFIVGIVAAALEELGQQSTQLVDSQTFKRAAIEAAQDHWVTAETLDIEY